jgi:hypothetical protein
MEPSLPQHLKDLLTGAGVIRIVNDNAQRPAESATEEYYRRLVLATHTRRESHVSYSSSPMPRRQKFRSSSVSPTASSGRPRRTVKNALKQLHHGHSLPPLPFKPGKNKINRWDNSACDEIYSPMSGASLLKMPVRSDYNIDLDDSPMCPVRKLSFELAFDDLDLLCYNSDEEDETSFTTLSTALSPCAMTSPHPAESKAASLERPPATAAAHFNNVILPRF